jgi:hypothetical protein
MKDGHRFSEAQKPHDHEELVHRERMGMVRWNGPFAGSWNRE